MLYTVRPLERIYAVPETFDEKRKEKSKADVQAQYREMPLPNGKIITRKEGEGYIIESIYSTDMTDYLNERYIPGRSIND